MHYTATQAKNQFGVLCRQAKQAPVIVEKAGRPDTVLLSYEAYQRLSAPSPAIDERRQFAQQYADWLTEQRKLVEDHGIWNDDVKVW